MSEENHRDWEKIRKALEEASLRMEQKVEELLELKRMQDSGSDSWQGGVPNRAPIAPPTGLGHGVPRFSDLKHLEEVETAYSSLDDPWLRGSLARMNARMRYAQLTNDAGTMSLVFILHVEALCHLLLRELYAPKGKWVRRLEVSWGWGQGRQVRKFHIGELAPLLPGTEFALNLDAHECYVQMTKSPERGIRFTPGCARDLHVFHHKCEGLIHGEPSTFYITSPSEDLTAVIMVGQWLRLFRLSQSIPSSEVDWRLYFGTLTSELTLVKGRGKTWCGLIQEGEGAFELHTWNEEDSAKWTQDVLEAKVQWTHMDWNDITTPVVPSRSGGRVKLLAEAKSRLRKEPPVLGVMSMHFMQKVEWLMVANSSHSNHWVPGGKCHQVMQKIYGERNRFVHSNMAYRRMVASSLTVSEMADFWSAEFAPRLTEWTDPLNAWSHRHRVR